MNLRRISERLAVALCALVALPSQAAPALIGADQVKAGKTTFSMYFIDAANLRKGSPVLSVTQAQTTLQQRLNAAGEGITACFLAADINANNVNCGGGLMRLGVDLFSTTTPLNHVPPTLNWLAEDANTRLDKTTSEYMINIRNTTVLTGPFDTARVVKVTFNKRIAQFGFQVDPYSFNTDPAAPPNEGRILDGIQFIVNGQATPFSDLTTSLRGDLPFVGVEDSNGFTEVTIVASGGGSLRPDRYTVVPLSNF